MEILAEELADQMPRPSRNLLFVMYVLAESRGDEVRTTLERQQDFYDDLDQLIVFIHPELGVTLLRRGLPLDLGLASQDYAPAAELVALIGEVDEGVAGEVARANAEGLRAGLATNHHPPFVGLLQWVDICDRFAPGLLDKVLASVPVGVVAKWADALRRTSSKKQIAPLVIRASQLHDAPAAAEAMDLIRRFPSLRRTAARGAVSDLGTSGTRTA